MSARPVVLAPQSIGMMVPRDSVLRLFWKTRTVGMMLTASAAWIEHLVGGRRAQRARGGRADLCGDVAAVGFATWRGRWRWWRWW